jgi:phospholipid N-methyltransferase
MTASQSTRTPQQALAALLEQHQPAHLLLVSESDLPAISAYSANHPDSQVIRATAADFQQNLADRRFDLAIIANCLEHLPKRQALELIGGIRNLNTNRMAVLIDLDACDWKEADFYSLAMQASESFTREAQTLTLFTYDLHSYKQIPDWLNAKFWANPQHFGKYWW